MSTPEDITFEALRAFGLSEGEVKTLLALIELGQKEPKDIASKAEVKQPKVYGHLNSLVEKEMVARIPIEGKPDRYEVLIDSVISLIDNYVQRTTSSFSVAKLHLELMKKQQSVAYPEFIRIFQGERAVESGVREILNEATSNIFIFTNKEFQPKVSIILDEIRAKNSSITINAPDIKDLFSRFREYASQMGYVPGAIQHLISGSVLPVIIFVDADFQSLSAKSANFVLPPTDGMDPVIFHFRHPVVIKFQLMVFSLVTSNLLQT